MKKILITGANGFIGSTLIHHLKDQFELFSIDRRPSQHLDKYHSFVCDIRDFKNIQEVFKSVQPDVLIHLAAIVHKKHADTSEKNYNLINFECNLRYVLHLFYNTYLINIVIIEKVATYFKRKGLFVFKRNFNKLFKSRKSSNCKAELLYEFQWILKNTLFGETS